MKISTPAKITRYMVNYLATYTTILEEDRDECIADTVQRSQLGHYTSTQAQREGRLLRESSVRGRRLTADVSFSLTSLVCLAMVDETLSRLVVLQAKQKP